LVLFNDQGGEFSAVIESVRGEAVTVKVLSYTAVDRESPRPIVLLQGVARGERMDLIVQKATELGVTHILPVNMARSVVQLDDARASKRQMHWRSIAIAACEQCGRNRLPHIEPVRELADALSALHGTDPSFIKLGEQDKYGFRGLLDPQSRLTLSQWLTPAPAASSAISLLVGPEGGLEDDERAMAERHGFTALRLGPRVLRTETAALAALAAIQSLVGDFA
jgi:16S rRNA (uracil1498-N3)-methyltransferase